MRVDAVRRERQEVGQPRQGGQWSPAAATAAASAKNADGSP